MFMCMNYIIIYIDIICAYFLNHCFFQERISIKNHHVRGQKTFFQGLIHGGTKNSKSYDDSCIVKLRAWVSKAKTEMEFPGSPFVQRRGFLVSDGCFAKIRLFPMTDSHGTGIVTYIEWLTFMINVGTVHIPHMDPMGFSKGLVHQPFQQNHLTLMVFDFQGEFLRHVQQDPLHQSLHLLLVELFDGVETSQKNGKMMDVLFHIFLRCPEFCMFLYKWEWSSQVISKCFGEGSDFEHVKKSESHLRPQTSLLHDRSAAIAQNKY